jgi:hypothetical protein
VIRQATADDLARVVELGEAFHAACPYREFAFDAAAFGEFALRLIDGGVILLSDDGMLGGLLNPLYFNPAAVMGCELFWWAGKTGRQLREAFEEWAKDNGAVGVMFSGLSDEREPTIRKVFARAGYQPGELAFFKRF